MKRRLFLALAGSVAMALAGCAGMDNSMAGSAVDIPNEDRSTEVSPIHNDPSPSPAPAQGGGAQQGPVGQ
jgi:hypothetical protein